MTLLDALRSALTALSANKLRSGLTILGIVIGIAAVTALVAIGRGVQARVTSRIQALGSNLLFVQPQGVTGGRIRGSANPFNPEATLTLEDAAALLDPARLPLVRGVAPLLQGFRPVVRGDTNTTATIAGVTPDALWMRNYDLAAGEFVSEQHLRARSLVAVLGANVAEALFPDQDPIGQTIRIARLPFRVIGVLKSKGGMLVGLEDDTVLIPITTYIARLGAPRSPRGSVAVPIIFVSLVEGADVEEAKAQIASVLRERHRLVREDQEDDFVITSQEDILQAVQEISTLISGFLGTVATLALLIGGIGVMNIMLVSVTERTREIGLRKALGARRRDILVQFLLEAVVLTFGGGVLGVLLGWAMSTAASRIPHPVFPDTSFFPAILTPDVVLLASAVSIATGLFFGLYPAYRASRLDPIQALRSE